jgi:predicted membrane protein
MSMTSSLTILIVKAISIAYGFLALALAVLYSLSRPDTWKRLTKEERHALAQGTEPKNNQSPTLD